MTKRRSFHFFHKRFRFGFHRDDSDGFATAEFVVLMGLTIMLLATFVNVLLVENVRTTTLSSLRDAARAGTRVVDLRRVAETTTTADDDLAINACEQRLSNSLHELTPSLSTATMDCAIGDRVVNGHDHYYMKASFTGGSSKINLVPWASIFSSQLDHLSATYVPTEAARE